MSDAEIKEFVAERDKAASGSLEQFGVYAARRGMVMTLEMLEIAYHKLRSASMNLDVELRLGSDKWLKDRNYTSWL